MDSESWWDDPFARNEVSMSAPENELNRNDTLRWRLVQDLKAVYEQHPWFDGNTLCDNTTVYLTTADEERLTEEVKKGLFGSGPQFDAQAGRSIRYILFSDKGHRFMGRKLLFDAKETRVEFVSPARANPPEVSVHPTPAETMRAIKAAKPSPAEDIFAGGVAEQVAPYSPGEQAGLMGKLERARRETKAFGSPDVLNPMPSVGDIQKAYRPTIPLTVVRRVELVVHYESSDGKQGSKQTLVNWTFADHDEFSCEMTNKTRDRRNQKTGRVDSYVFAGEETVTLRRFFDPEVKGSEKP